MTRVLYCSAYIGRYRCFEPLDVKVKYEHMKNNASRLVGVGEGFDMQLEDPLEFLVDW